MQSSEVEERGHEYVVGEVDALFTRLFEVFDLLDDVATLYKNLSPTAFGWLPLLARASSASI